ncbi:MAG: hypothetical protein K9L24_03600 [Spirochaetia bacterium]|nr:hypothetical protein [Spirochaetia bacterium]MCF7946872.1 hypothetical protein [Spirochaetia bacterium]MCF7953906.1 hypothetical protein [Spirochaetales bacterium]
MSSIEESIRDRLSELPPQKIVEMIRQFYKLQDIYFIQIKNSMGEYVVSEAESVINYIRQKARNQILNKSQITVDTTGLSEEQIKNLYNRIHLPETIYLGGLFEEPYYRPGVSVKPENEFVMDLITIEGKRKSCVNLTQYQYAPINAELKILSDLAIDAIAPFFKCPKRTLSKIISHIKTIHGWDSFFTHIINPIIDILLGIISAKYNNQTAKAYFDKLEALFLSNIEKENTTDTSWVTVAEQNGLIKRSGDKHYNRCKSIQKLKSELKKWCKDADVPFPTNSEIRKTISRRDSTGKLKQYSYGSIKNIKG